MIKKYVKRPIPIQAVVWDGYNFDTIRGMAGPDIVELKNAKHYPDLIIHTLEGILHAEVGDWIIKTVRGEVYPCKNDIFAETYEEVEND